MLCHFPGIFKLIENHGSGKIDPRQLRWPWSASPGDSSADSKSPRNLQRSQRSPRPLSLRFIHLPQVLHQRVRCRVILQAAKKDLTGLDAPKKSENVCRDAIKICKQAQKHSSLFGLSNLLHSEQAPPCMPKITNGCTFEVVLEEKQ